MLPPLHTPCYAADAAAMPPFIFYATLLLRYYAAFLLPGCH